MLHSVDCSLNIKQNKQTTKPYVNTAYYTKIKKSIYLVHLQCKKDLVLNFDMC